MPTHQLPLPQHQPLPNFKGIMNNNNLDSLRSVQSTYYDSHNSNPNTAVAYQDQTNSNYHINSIPPNFYDNSSSEVFVCTINIFHQFAMY